ncbi:hypothetical protein [Pseudomonas sp. S32]|uniref:hypothetical protein n=1 Tax=Pseudomonas sp. S32 TaxID=2767448 RepID=UPI0019139E91|nr:hypothetical protein [Pseudomonas sp. S32]MBK5003748.1 hypothetical protein [Pseudomonas sp. S32]
MRSYELIKDLERKLSLYERDNPPSRQIFNEKHQRVAELIAASEIYPPLLNRGTVKELLERRLGWPTEDGGELFLAYAIDIEALEAVRAISFPNGYLKVLASMEVASDMPSKLRAQLNALQFLRDVQIGWEGLLAPKLQITYSALNSHDLVLLEPYLKRRGEYALLSIDTREVESVGSQVWELLRASNTVDEAFATYTLKMRLVTGWNFIFDLDFDRPEIDKEEFLKAGVDYVLSDQSLNDDWTVCAVDVVLGQRGVRQIASGDGAGRRKHPDQLDLGLIKGLMDPAGEDDSLYEKAQWWGNSTRWGNHSGGGLSGSLVATIIRSENNWYGEDSSFPLTKKLLECAPKLPRLIGMLLESAIEQKYLCMLLSFFPTNHIGLIEVYWSIRRIRQLNSSKIAYDKIWKNLLWAQALDIYVGSYSGYFSAAQVMSGLEHLAEAIAWLVEGELGGSSHGKSIDDTCLPALNKAIMAIKYVDVSGSQVQLFPLNIESFVGVVKSRLEKRGTKPGQIPLGEWIALFWMLKATSGMRDNKASALKSVSIQLARSYLAVLNALIKKKCSEREAPVAFDELDWVCLYRNLSKVQRVKLIYVFEDLSTDGVSGDSNRLRSFISGVRMHLRLLLTLHAAGAELESVCDSEGEIVSIVEKFGFGGGRYSGALDYFVDNSEYSPIRVWQQICVASNLFNDSMFDRLVTLISSEHVPLTAIYTLLERVDAPRRKALIESKISVRGIASEKLHWMPQIYELITKAANHGQHEMASYYIEYARKSSHGSHGERLNGLSAQIKLKEVFDDVSLSAVERFEKLKAFRRSDDMHLPEVEHYCEYLLATAEIEVDASSALRRFERMSLRPRAIREMSGLVRAALEKAKVDANIEWYLYCDRWVCAYENLKLSSLEDMDLYYILKLSLQVLNMEVFERFWSVASIKQQDNVEISLLRCEYLKCVGRTGEAFDRMRRVRSLHKNLPDEIEKMASIFEGELSERSTVALSIDGLFSSGSDPLSVWRNICNMQAVDQVKVFSDSASTLDEYLLDVIDHIGLELLLRRMHLRRSYKMASSNISPLAKENSINDWLVSLLRQRMNFAGWTVRDQSRSGSSASGDDVGEVDAWIMDKGDRYIALIEAFRLKAIERNVIREHMNKIHLYNSVGCSTVLIVVYVAAANFASLSDRYCKFIQGLSYDGFERGAHFSLVRILTRSSPHIRYYKEVRLLNQVPVTFYHQLLNLQS